MLTLLKDEHRTIERRLGSVANTMKSPEITPAKLRESIRQLGSELKSHFAEEERNLYAPLRSRLGKNNPIDEMIAEHVSIFRAYRLLSSTYEKYELRRDRASDLRYCVDSLKRGISQHVRKEEMVLFWLAELKL